MQREAQVRCLDTLGEMEIKGLCDVLIDCVEGGASVSFMLPMSREKAERAATPSGRIRGMAGNVAA